MVRLDASNRRIIKIALMTISRVTGLPARIDIPVQSRTIYNAEIDAIAASI